jgi:hypothetical protein
VRPRFFLGAAPRWWALCLTLGLMFTLPTAAQDGGKRARRAAHAKRVKTPQVESETPPTPKKKRGSRSKTRSKQERETAVARAADAPPAKAELRAPGSNAAEATAQAAASGVNAQIVREGDTSVKMMEFTGLGIEGRLKSPQLVYFVQRVRAEFEHPVLPHRSFLPELADSAQREPAR